MHVARQVLSRFAGGITYVPLELLRDPALVLPALAKAFFIKLGEADPATTIAHALADTEALLVLDNFEQVLEAARSIAQILEQAVGLHVLATSQALLRIRGEQAYPLAPMNVEDAVVLFVARARASDPSFEPTEGEYREIVSLVGRLECMPLATELTAARICLFGVSGLSERVAEHAGFSDQSADRPDRHRTTEAAVQWSYELLDDNERRTLRLLSIFDGGFTLDAAEALVGSEALDLIASLLDKSLITSKVSRGEARFSMLESIGRFAGERRD